MLNIIIPKLISWYLRFVKLTSRITILNSENLEKAKQMSASGNYTLSCWHEHYPTCVLSEVDTGLVVMASKSKDGTLAANTVEALGFTPTRGSSSRGGSEALKSMIKLIKSQKLNSAITVDGPRGPRRIPKKGTFVVSLEAQVPILNLQAISTRRFCFSKSWDQTNLPLPFGHIYINYGEPILITELNKDSLNEYSQQLIAQQQKLTDEIRQYLVF